MRARSLKCCELVRVDSPLFLVSSDQRACRYETADGLALAPGYYVAVWPIEARLSSYGIEVRYFGPYPTRTIATWLQSSAVALRLVDVPTDSTLAVVSRPLRP